MKELTADEFLKRAEDIPVIDVRTPAEFSKGHIPGAVNIPLFTNDERAKVGTLYKRKGRNEAVLKGLEIVGPKLASFVKDCRDKVSEKEVLVHCWRGGMRSSSFAWLLETAGIEANILKGGYKAYRAYIRQSFSIPEKIIILGGMTGSGKTEILHQLRDRGEQVLDLEGLANHKGSGFGFIGQNEQPTNEQFENNSWQVWKDFDFQKRIWLEDESLKIGKVVLNEVLYGRVRNSQLLVLDVPKSVRIKRLEKEYCIVDPQILKGVIEKIKKRLGPDRAMEVNTHIDSGDFDNAINIVLKYYDKYYSYGMGKRDEAAVHILKVHEEDTALIADKILYYLEENPLV